jgi:glycosyl transferase family 1
MNIVLIGHYRPRYRLSYYYDWRDAFLDCRPAHSVRVINTYRTFRRPVRLFESLPLGWSLPRRALRGVFGGGTPCDLLVLPPSFFYFNRGRRGRFFRELAAAHPKRFPTVFFVENEYRLLEEKVALAEALRADVLVSQLPADVAPGFYGRRFGGKVVSCPAALNPRVFRPLRPPAARPIDVGTRSHVYPESLGDRDRNALLECFSSGGGPVRGLKVDISTDERDRFSRDGWAQFLNRCRATVSTEAGAVHIAWEGRPDTAVSGKAISSRHFEAMGTKTVQIMFRGRFNGLLVAGEHYLPLERDFSNLPEVCAAVKDEGLITRMSDVAHEYALDAHTYAHRVRCLLAQL